MRFSERYGYKPARDAFQVESMDEALRNRLSNRLRLVLGSLENDEDRARFCRAVSDCHFKEPSDSIEPFHMEDELQQRFLSCQWHEAYDLLEFTARYVESLPRLVFVRACNCALEEERAGYRFVGDPIAPITDQVEVEAIDRAVKEGGGLPAIQTHLKAGLAHLSDRQNPDYRNSIKESISAVEALACLVTAEKKATLGKALDLIERQGKVKLHDCLRKAFDKLYGWTSDAGGIRHALRDKDEPSLADAKFMLVACSAFVNYVVAVCADCGIALAKGGS